MSKEEKNESVKSNVNQYRNRIKRIEKDVDPSSLNLNPYNFRLHQKPQIETMDEILKNLGFIGAVIAVDKTRNVIDGHMRVQMYVDAQEKIPVVIFLDLENEEEERQAILVFDEIGKMARTDRKTLEKVINQTRVKNEKTRDVIKHLANRKKIDIDIDKATGRIDAKATIDNGDKDNIEKTFDHLIEKHDVMNHSVWEITEDLILIKGDSTGRDIKDIVISYNPEAILTDSPYGIDVVGSDGRIGLAKHFGDIKGDTEPFDPKPILDWQLPSIIWGANHFSDKLPSFPRMLVWNKKGIGNQSNDFADAEIAWCSERGVIRVFDHVWRGAARASERGVDRLHPTQKPIELFKWCIKDFLLKDDKGRKRNMFLDLYGGVGTILVSAHLLGVGAISIELDERFVAATLERMYNITQREAKAIK
jgi:site-specific DNA-methyltransferase (adenine-specific)